MAELVDAFEAQGGNLKLAEVARTHLLDEAVLEVPFVVADQGQDVPVFVYGTADGRAAGHLEAARKILEGIGAPPPVYYAMAPLPAPEPADPTRPFGADLLSKRKEDPPDGEYAMWWTTPEDPSFATSKTVESMDRAYRGLEGIESYVLAAILRELEVVDEKTGRAALPREEATLVLEGPEDRVVILTMSQEKGIRFHFHTKTTSVQYRDRFWKLFARYAEEWKAGAVERSLPQDPPSPAYGRPTAWWSAARKAGARHGAEGGEGTVMSFGCVIFGKGAGRHGP